jgi:hypothetical protein
MVKSKVYIFIASKKNKAMLYIGNLKRWVKEKVVYCFTVAYIQISLSNPLIFLVITRDFNLSLSFMPNEHVKAILRPRSELLVLL